MTGTRVVMAAIGALVLGVSACSGSDPEPRVEPSPSASSSTASSGSPSPSVLGPERTFRAWIAARNAALQTGDISAALKLSADSCRTCRNSLEPIVAVYENGGRYRTKGWAVVAARLKDQNDSRATVSAALKYFAGTTIPGAGSDPISYGVERHIVQADLQESADGWRVAFIGYLS